MITIIYCPELNIFRIKNILTGKQAVKTETELSAIAPWIIENAKNQPNIEILIGF